MSADAIALTRADWIVLAVYLVAIVAFGVWMGRGNKKVDDFFLAGREMRWWAAGLSVMATQISAITFVGTTGQAYTQGMSFLAFYLGLPFAMVILSATLVPFFYRSGVFTAYEYLERRFDSRTRTLASLLFLASRSLAVGVTLYAPSLVLSVILGWSETTTILLMGGTTIVYVAYGGNRSVIWTDVAQMGLIWFGIFLCVGVALTRLPDGFAVRDGLALAQATGRLETMDPSTDLTKPYTVWSGLIGGLFLAMAYFGCDQSQVQRYLSGRSLTESRLSLLFNAFLKVPMQFIILLTGVLVFVFFHFHAPPLLWNRAELARVEQAAPAGRARAGEERVRGRPPRAPRGGAGLRRGPGRRGGRRAMPATTTSRRCDGSRRRRPRPAGLAETVTGKPYNDTNYIFPTFIVSQLAGGLAGLVIAVIFAAAMSSLSAEFNSLATASLVDFYRRFFRRSASDAHYLAVSRVFTAVLGAARLRRRPQGGAARLGHRGGQPARLVLLRVDPRGLRPGGPHPPGHRARGLLRPAGGDGGGLPGLPAHPDRLPLVQRRRRGDGVRRRPR